MNILSKNAHFDLKQEHHKGYNKMNKGWSGVIKVESNTKSPAQPTTKENVSAQPKDALVHSYKSENREYGMQTHKIVK